MLHQGLPQWQKAGAAEQSFGLNSTTKPKEWSEIETNRETLLRHARMGEGKAKLISI